MWKGWRPGAVGTMLGAACRTAVLLGREPAVPRVGRALQATVHPVGHASLLIRLRATDADADGVVLGHPFAVREILTGALVITRSVALGLKVAVPNDRIPRQVYPTRDDPLAVGQ